MPWTSAVAPCKPYAFVPEPPQLPFLAYVQSGPGSKERCNPILPPEGVLVQTLPTATLFVIAVRKRLVQARVSTYANNRTLRRERERRGR